jgi:lipopolysaccharide transport system ATP-binding protein
MLSPRVKVESIGKVFHIYDKPTYRLRQFLVAFIFRIFRKPELKFYRDYIALEDVSFVVNRGETLGVIGRNGSGKSTLLQIICGTLTPSSGDVRILGRVAALLELGSGFNFEFTGRENVYLNASILGLSKEQIDQRFDQILEFADIGDYIEQPVKTYSSGMMVRLAFAVIANVDADILVIDEALAVGDAVFIQKCMRFIRNFQKNGTLIFVSHDSASVQSLCDNCIWLHEGKVERFGKAKDVCDAYLQFTLQEIYGEESLLTTIASVNDENSSSSAIPAESIISYGETVFLHDNLHSATGWKTGYAEVISVRLYKIIESDKAFFEGGERVRLTIKAKSFVKIKNPIIGFLFRDKLGQDLFGENTLSFTNINPTPVDENVYIEAHFDFKLPMLPNGDYAVMVSIADGDFNNQIQHHWVHDALIVNVTSSKLRYGLVGLDFNNVQLIVSDYE